MSKSQKDQGDLSHQLQTRSALIQARVNGEITMKTLADTGCSVYAVIDRSLVDRLGIPYIDKKRRLLNGFADTASAQRTHGIVQCEVETGGYVESVVAHVVGDLEDDLILGLPWMEHNDVVFHAKQRLLWHGRAAIRLRLRGEREPKGVQAIRDSKLVSASVFAATCRRIRRGGKEALASAVRAISLADIRKAIERLDNIIAVDPADYVPREILKEFPDLFAPEKSMQLPPHRPGVDHAINLLRDSMGQEADLPFGPLYGMSREELLVLRKTLNDLLDKGFIRVSSSSAASPVLFVKKPGGGIRFCVDYRALNAITTKDRYPLPLISETLRSLAAAKWYTKLDVVAAFHKLRIAEGDQHKTAFRTRFGLFEWLVVPFGLSGAPATFQRYINDTLREFLDDFVTAYLDDVLIFTDGSQKDHMRKVRLVLRALAAAGLHLDPKKCVFAAKEVTYLGFIISAGKGISCDPEKQRAISEWEAPTHLKGVQSFLGFANYYRIFIPDFAEIAGPLIALTKKGVTFVWGSREEAAFLQLKKRFCEAPILRDWDPERPTFVEADASGLALGGCLSQEDEQGRRYAVAFYSQRFSPAEKNYPIHDREMLAIIRCLEAWRSYLRSCGPFVVISDHKNLQYFTTKQHLSSRQVRWAEMLSEYDWHLQYRPGRDSPVPDALSRRDPDGAYGALEGSGKGTWMQLIPASALQRPSERGVEPLVIPDEIALRAITEPGSAPAAFPEDDELQGLWEEAFRGDQRYHSARTAVSEGHRRFKPELKLKVNITECQLDTLGRLTFRDRLWLPGGEGSGEDPADELRTRVVDKTHRALCVGHPGREATIEAVGRQFYWPGMSKLIRAYVRKCDTCGRSAVWRETRRGFLKPLPVPLRIRCDLAMDFMVSLPKARKTGRTVLWVIVDRLTKNVTVEAMGDCDAAACAERFLSCHYRFHGLPKSIVSDRGPQWTSDFWRHLCKLAGIQQRLSTAYHPETDGQTERANQEVLTYLRCFVDFAQTDWEELLPGGQLALNNRKSSATSLSPFFIEHGYHVDPLEVKQAEEQETNGPQRDARRFLERLEETIEFTQAAVAATAQRMEDTANKKRTQSEVYAKDDWVWLSTKNFRSKRPSKKLGDKWEKFQVEKMVSPLVVELRGVPGAMYPRFHVDLVRRADTRPLRGQTTEDPRPPAIMVDDEKEYAVEEILCARTKQRGRGKFRECYVRWRGYRKPSWEPVEYLAETEALDRFEATYGPIEGNDGPLADYEKPQRGRHDRARRPQRGDTVTG